MTSSLTMKSDRCCLVESDSCDWYVIPVEMMDEWYDKWSFADDTPEWATEVGGNPNLVSFLNWEIED